MSIESITPELDKKALRDALADLLPRIHELDKEDLLKTVELLIEVDETQQKEAKENAATIKRLEHQISIDSLTGANSRDCFNHHMDLYLAQCKRTNEHGVLIFIDLDKFKRINDLYGHLSGDATLVQIVDLIKSQIRTTDSVYRYGGDEFLVLLRNVDADSVMNKVSNLEKSLQKVSIKLYCNTKATISASFGYCPVNRESVKEDLIAEVDEKMYFEKHDKDLCKKIYLQQNSA